MIIEITKSNMGKTAHCICDKCGKEFNRPISLLNAKNHYCSRECCGGGRSEVNPNACSICGKPRDNSFYDKSSTRPLCSKACYSVYFDNHFASYNTWERKGLPRNVDNNVSITNNVFYKQGRLILSDYNLGVW
jgi:endogenous inhibitor of DNA gyrase (YacG/DUF329 family)